MLKILRPATLAMLGIFAANFAYAEDKPAATVNGTPIPQERVDLRTKMIAAQQPGQHDSPELRKSVREDLINVELMSQEAIRKNLDKQAEAAEQLVLVRQTALVAMLVQDYMKAHPVSEEAIAKEYEAVKVSLGSKEYKVLHILLDNESDAIAISGKLKKGGKNNTFEKLATNSKDMRSKDHGGEVGWVAVGNIPTTFVKPFADVLVNLTKGQISEPVQSQIGWHIIKLDDVRDLKMPSLEELKPQLVQRLQQQAIKQLVSELRDKAKIE